MADQIPFSIAEEILTKLGSLVAQEIGLARGVRKELKKLGDTLTTIKAVLLNAEQQQQEDRAVEIWVRRFKDVIYDADDLLDDFATYEVGRGGMARQVSRFFSSSNQVAFHFRMGHRIKDIRGRLDDIANDISEFNFIPRVTASMPVANTGRETHSFVLTSEIMGRDEDKKKIIKLLLQSNNEENLSIVAIVGIGGLGKTTLAQLVYNDEEVQKHFDLRLWVCVSDDFDVKTLVRNIIKSATCSDVENLELDQLQVKLRENLTQKRYLLVLDDVWNEDFEKWDQLRILLKVGARGSEVVVTTRSSKVASTMGIDSPYVLKGLDECQSLALFKSLAFGEDQQKAHPRLLQIGEEITKMCNGVPLVIRTLGRMLSSKTEESQWLSIKNNENLMSLRDGNNILLVLKLSYDNLPSHLKQCFTYCALFPKDYKIEKKMLIQLWMAQGYIQPLDENERLEDVGDQYFKELLSRSMFQEVEINENNNIISCKMHDLIHDLAQFIVKSEIFILTNDVKTIPERIYHVSILGWSQGMKVLKGKSIRTLFIPSNMDYDPCADSMVNTLVLNCKCLRALDLFAELGLPKSVIKLGHLRYLSLSYGEFEVLPSGFTSLQNLQTLKLWKCEHLKELPRNIRKMINLRHLEIDGCRRLNYMPCRLGELTMLQTLHLAYLDALECMFENSSSAEPFFPSLKTLELDELCNFKGWWRREIVGEQAPSFPSLSELKIKRCNQLTTVQLPSCPSLSELEIYDCSQLTTVQLLSSPHLSKLVIRYCINLESLQLPPCPSLSELEITWCHLLTTVQLLSSRHLSKLVIDGCVILESLQLHSSCHLSKLVINACFSLESLQLHSLPCLEELELRGVREEILWRIISVSSSLKSLHIYALPDVVSLPDDRLQHLTSLKSLKIELCVFQGIQHLNALEELRIESCMPLYLLDKEDNDGGLQFQGLTSLRKLFIRGIPKLVSLPKGLQHVTTLETLSITDCDDFTTLPDWISSLTSLSELKIKGCPRFKLADRSKIAHIPTIDIF